MAILNAEWYAANEGRAYPLSDAATREDHAGGQLPDDLLVDLSLRWPDSLGQHAFLAAASVSARLATLAFEAADDLDDPSSFRPLAVVSVTTPFAVRRHIRLLPQADGVGGWAVFGSGVAAGTYSGRLTPRAGLLTPRAARPYRRLPVAGIREARAATAMTGVVSLRADPPLYARKEERRIEGVLRDVVVIGLAEQADGGGGFLPSSISLADAASSSVFARFAGPCAGRPESGTCGDPAPIEFVNGVGPDCDGVLTLDFRGCVHPVKLDDHAFVIECSQGLSATCLPAYLADEDGVLPEEG